MAWALEIVAKEYEKELKIAGIVIKLEAAVLITPTAAVLLSHGLSTDKYRRIIRDEIQRVQDVKKAAIQAKQVSLL